MAVQSPTVLRLPLWASPEGYIAAESHGPASHMTSHKAVCLLKLNTTQQEAHVEITLFFSDREPARRTKHLRFNNLEDPEPVPRDTDYSSVIVSNVPMIAQHTLFDSRQAENALLSPIAFAGDV